MRPHSVKHLTQSKPIFSELMRQQLCYQTSGDNHDPNDIFKERGDGSWGLWRCTLSMLHGYFKNYQVVMSETKTSFNKHLELLSLSLIQTAMRLHEAASFLHYWAVGRFHWRRWSRPFNESSCKKESCGTSRPREQSWERKRIFSCASSRSSKVLLSAGQSQKGHLRSQKRRSLL